MAYATVPEQYVFPYILPVQKFPVLIVRRRNQRVLDFLDVKRCDFYVVCMKRVKILVCGFSLAIALVALPFPYIDDITSGLGFSIAAVLFAWLGILERRGAKNGYKRDVRLYSASTMMKVVHVEESEYDRWEDQPDGSSKLRREKAFLPTYEYSLNG